MLGLTKREIQERFDEIVDFAELREFIDAPVKTYSSGMYMRLGFAVAIHVDPDVLLVDEVLAVGDEGFTHKCLDKFAEFRRRGKTILLVTHSLGLDRAVLRRSAVARRRPRRCRTAIPSASSAPTSRRSRKARRQLLADDHGEGGAKSQPRSRTCRTGRTAPARCSRRHSRPTPTLRTCFRRPKGAGARARSRSPTSRSSIADGQPSFVFHSGDPIVGPRQGAGARSRSTISCSASACSTPTASAATAPTPISRR